MGSRTPLSLEDRVGDTQDWARSRIATCRAAEAKFGAAWSIDRHGPPQALVEAWTERRALEAVLRMLANEGRYE